MVFTGPVSKCSSGGGTREITEVYQVCNKTTEDERRCRDILPFVSLHHRHSSSKKCSQSTESSLVSFTIELIESFLLSHHEHGCR